jgi:predicted 2-oxoglutarate/Fe(II)-dependent dioxygenase YbiX
VSWLDRFLDFSPAPVPEELTRFVLSWGFPQCASRPMALKRDFGNGKWPFGGQGGPNDVPSPTGAGCMKISEVLASADEQAGEYSFGGVGDTLPAPPGLLVGGVGMLRFPLGETQAQELIAQCKKSPFGHNMDTKMDESVRKSWQLQPDQLELKNPSWQTGIAELTEQIARRLGYKGVPLQAVLYKLLVYGEGGHFLKHQDTEKEDGMIATLVVQPPSAHEGGDLVVYRNGGVQHRHDFGKAAGTAAYLPHYAVHYADAEHSLEKVTKGFRLALVYSVCLPASMRHLKRDPNKRRVGRPDRQFGT